MFYKEKGELKNKSVNNIVDAFLTKTDYDSVFVSGNKLYFGNEGFDCDMNVLNGEEMLFGQPESFDGTELFSGLTEIENMVPENEYGLYEGYNLTDTDIINMSSKRSSFSKNGYFDGMCATNVISGCVAESVESGITSGKTKWMIEVNKNLTGCSSVTILTPENDIINGHVNSAISGQVIVISEEGKYDSIFDRYSNNLGRLAFFPAYEYTPDFNPFYSVTNVVFIENYGFLTKDDFEESMNNGTTDAVSIINPTIIGETCGGFYSGNGINVNFSPFSAITNEGRFMFTYSPKNHKISGITWSGRPFSTTYGYYDNSIDVNYSTFIKENDKEKIFDFDENSFSFDFPQFIGLKGTVSTSTTSYTISIDSKYANLGDLKFYTDYDTNGSGFTGLFYESGDTYNIPYFNDYSKFDSEEIIISAYTTMRIFNDSTESASTESLGNIRPLLIENKNKDYIKFSYIDKDGNYKSVSQDKLPEHVGYVTLIPKKKNDTSKIADDFSEKLGILTTGGQIEFSTAGISTISFNLGSDHLSNPNITTDKIVAIKEIYDEKASNGDKILKARIIKIYTGKDIIVNGH